MAWGVNEIQVIDITVVGGIVQLDSGGLDGNAPLPLQLHGVQQLLRPDPLVDGVALLQQTVRQGGFAVVNMGNNGKISDLGKFGHMAAPSYRVLHAGHTMSFSQLYRIIPKK